MSAWTDDVVAIFTALAAFGTFVTALLLYVTFRAESKSLDTQRAELKRQAEESLNLRRAEQGQRLIDYLRRWDGADLLESRSDAESFRTAEELRQEINRLQVSRKDLDLRDRMRMPLLLRVPSYFEDMAVLVETGAMEPKDLSSSMGNVVASWWDWWKPSIEYLRAIRWPTGFRGFERIASLVVERDERPC